MTMMKKSKVDHTYIDHSQDLVLNNDHQESNKNLFPAKLHKIVSTPGYQHIIAWRPHGRAWKIVNKPLFISVVLPEHFNHSNFSSFNRSVNGWGFKRLAKEGPDHNAYYHPLFLRGKHELTSAMTRLVNPGRRLTNKDAEPDLYEISRRYTLDPAPGIANNPPMAETEADSNKRASSPIFTIPGMPHLAHRPSHYNRPLPTFHHPMPYDQHPPHPQPLLHLNVAQYPSSMLTPTMSTESSNHVQPGHFPPHSSTQPMGNQHAPGYYDPLGQSTTTHRDWHPSVPHHHWHPSMPPHEWHRGWHPIVSHNELHPSASRPTLDGHSQTPKSPRATSQSH